mgnify:CR=1 FL=1
MMREVATIPARSSLFFDINAKFESPASLTRDVTSMTNLDKQSKMASLNMKVSRHGGKYCVAGGPNGVSCTNSQFTPNVSMHKFPRVPTSDSDKEIQTTRRKWINFVGRHRPNFNPSSTSVLCSIHFENSCFTHNVQISDKLGTKRKLLPGSTPTLDVASASSNISQAATASTARERRQVSIL